MIVRFDNQRAAEKIFFKNKNLKMQGSTTKTKYIIVKPRTPEEIQREDELKLEALAKNLVVPTLGSSWIVARTPDGARGPVLKPNSDLKLHQVFNQENFNAKQIRKAREAYLVANPVQDQQDDEDTNGG